MGDDSPRGPGPWGIPTQGSTTDHGEAAPEVSGRELVISTSVIVNAGSGI